MVTQTLETQEMKVAVIILNWNGEALLREFLPSVLRFTNPDLARIIVVDNGSQDTSLEVLKKEFPDVEVMPFDQNYGFAGGYNKAIEKLKEEYLVLLNSDVEVTQGWLQPLVAVLDENPLVAAVQPKIKAYTEKEKFEYAGACGGFIDKWGYPFCRGRILDIMEHDSGQYDDVREVFWASGAAFCVRREYYTQCGGLDEAFFAHMEEIDLCWKLRNAGYIIKVCPLSTVYHLGGGSLPMQHPKKLFLNYRNDLLMLYKNLPRKESRKVLIVRSLFDIASFIVFVLKGEFKNAASVYKAYRSFWGMRKNYTQKANSPFVHGSACRHSCMYRGSIVLAYFLRRVKKFSELTF
ncbi:glycosyl transferase [Bacteroidia bacterium]|nr:glycosyl transferase [Bacteroidia bacterium]